MAEVKEMNPNEYVDYCRVRNLSRTSHRAGDTAVMGMRPKLSLPYWVHKAITRGGCNNPWSWVMEPGSSVAPNENTERFGRMFPEFLDCNEVKAVQDSHLWDTFDKATKYLNDKLKDIKAGVDR